MAKTPAADSRQQPDRSRATWPSRAQILDRLFFTWAALFIGYVAIILSTMYKSRVGFELASDAAWKVAYLFVPVLGAFGGYMFANHTGPAPNDSVKVSPRLQRNVFILTATLHAVPFLVLLIGVVLEDFSMFNTSRPDYIERTNFFIRVLLLIWSGALLPVGWLLRTQPAAPRRSPPPPPRPGKRAAVPAAGDAVPEVTDTDDPQDHT